MPRYRLQFTNRGDQVVNAETAQAAVDAFCADPGNAESRIVRVVLGDNEIDEQPFQLPGDSPADETPPAPTKPHRR